MPGVRRGDVREWKAVHMKARILSGAAALLAAAGLLETARANLAIADVGDLVVGNLAGQAGGTGWTGNWSGSAQIFVTGGDLTSPLYAAAQSGTPQRIRSSNTSGLRQEFRRLAAPATNELWFSFLAQTANATTGAGLSFNPPTASPFDNPSNAFIHLIGTNLLYRFGHTSDQLATNRIAISNTVLVVGRLVLVGGEAADSVSFWINPDLVADPVIAHYPPVYSDSSLHFLDRLTNIGVIAHNSGGSTAFFGNVDNLRISDGSGDPAAAFLDVTGINATSSPPVITAQPQDQTNTVGGTAGFSVIASGAPPPFYQWQFQTNDLAGETNATLTLTGVARTNSGAYRVIVSNAAGAVASSNALLFVTTEQKFLAAAAAAGGGLRLSFADHDGGLLNSWDVSILTVQGATDLVNPDWQTLPGAVVISNGLGQLEVAVSNGPPQQFFRVRMP